MTQDQILLAANDLTPESTPEQVQAVLSGLKVLNDEYKEKLDCSTDLSPDDKEKLMQLWIQRNNDINRLYDYYQK